MDMGFYVAFRRNVILSTVKIHWKGRDRIIGVSEENDFRNMIWDCSVCYRSYKIEVETELLNAIGFAVSYWNRKQWWNLVAQIKNLIFKSEVHFPTLYKQSTLFVENIK